MIKKEFLLEEEDIKILQRVKEENHFRSEGQAARYMIQEYQKNAAKNDPRDIKQQLNLLIAIVRDIETDSGQVKDAINTILVKSEIEACIPVGLLESPVLAGSREYKKKRLGKLKQKKDSNIRKKGVRVKIST